ncbi:hypothetical protein ACQKFM_21135 [Paenibacillus xylanexedens]|uniref:hypothetical protein n=1 Tax=Paenibacillus xylanexedens TaxID=528191 RepID=UPI003D087808
MLALHSSKINSEKNAFINELFSSLPAKQDIIDGPLSHNAKRLHESVISLLIMKHYCKRDFLSNYFEAVMTNIIEAECLMLLGFRNSSYSLLRGAVEASFKLLYFEYHPIESRLHSEDKFDLTGKEYRNFFYIFPGLCDMEYLSRDKVEKFWGELCSYVHGDLRVLTPLNVVSDISTFLSDSGREFENTVNMLKAVSKLISSIFFAVEPAWLENVEKAYFDAVFDIYTPQERTKLKEKLRIL